MSDDATDAILFAWNEAWPAAQEFKQAAATLTHHEGDETMHVLRGMTIEAKRGAVLQALRDNRKEHAEIVEEAKAGYAAKAVEQLQKALDQVRKGEIDPAKGWSAHLRPVVDHTKIYDRAIKLFEMEQREVVELTQEQVGCLIMDEWAWKEEFIGSNAIYSPKAAASL